MLCEPTESVDVENVAWPELSVPVPRVVAPSLKVTVPAGVPAPGATADTVAVNVTDWPKTEGFAVDDSDVDVLAWFTLCVSIGDAGLALKFPSPL